MKNIFFLILTTLFSINVIGQTTEFSFHLTSGLFSFRGSESGTTTIYTAASDFGAYSTWSPFGKHSGFSYCLGFNAQRITDSHFIFGIRTSYESLSSSINIDKVINITSSGGETWDAYDSRTILTNRFINIFPFLGNRMNVINGVNSDLIFGFDIGAYHSIKEHATINANQKSYNTTKNSLKEKWDYRLHVEMINYYKRVGLSIGYSYGLTNYLFVPKYNNFEKRDARSRMLRFGLVYKI
ncbi:MAG: hypothetical protein KKG99_11880 [Bacteroidetes bacterium]|nr:hypothetical protein [Bacteroidota bacterium]